MKRWYLAVPGLLLLVLAACAGQGSEGPADGTTVPPTLPARSVYSLETPGLAAGTPTTPAVDLTMPEGAVSLAPHPLRAGVPFSVTAAIHNNRSSPAVNVPVMVYISPEREKIGFSAFLTVLTVTVPASQTLPLEIPVEWNFSGGDYQLWMQVNRLPDAWQAPGNSLQAHPIPTLPEADTSDNIVLREFMMDPFDAYASDLCLGRIDVEIGPADVLPEPAQQRVLVQVHNVGNRAVYNLPVVVLGQGVSGIAYTPAIPPCGGTAEVYVSVDGPFAQGESLSVQVNPREWEDGLVEDDFGNNQVAVSAGLAPGVVVPPGSGLEDYDFVLTSVDIETPELYIVLVTVHNLGTRDAAMVPIRIENERGRKITDSIPLVQGNGSGIAAIRVGYLWTRGGTLTLTVNPQDAKGAYPETDRGNNTATFALP
jgi:hypothetical protein